MNKLLSRIRNFPGQVDAYYPTYLAAHSKRGTKLAHIAGNVLTLGFIAFVLGLSTGSLWNLLLLVFVPFVVYPFAWLSHLLIEKNKPATFSVSPFLTKTCDWKMIIDIIRGKVKL